MLALNRIYIAKLGLTFCQIHTIGELSALSELQASSLLNAPPDSIRKALFDLKQQIDAAALTADLPQSQEVWPHSFYLSHAVSVFFVTELIRRTLSQTMLIQPCVRSARRRRPPRGQSLHANLYCPSPPQ